MGILKEAAQFVDPAHLYRLTSFVGSIFYKRYLRPDHFVRPVCAELFLTENCNLKCVTCACWLSKTRDELSYDKWISILDQLEKLRFVKLNFTGGEPLLRPDAMEIIGYAARHTRARIHLNTNATLLNPERIRALIDSRVLSYNISVDGPTVESHERIRGVKGSFAKTVGNLDALLALRESRPLKIRLCFTVNNANFTLLPDIADFAQKRKVRLFLNLATAKTFLFRSEGARNVADIDPAALDEVCGILQRKVAEKPDFLPSSREISYIPRHFRDDIQQSLPCAESQLKLMIHSQGQVGGCWAEDPDFSAREASIESILSSGKFRKRMSALYWKHCKGCGSNYSLNLRLSPKSDPALFPQRSP